eukprot:TRINITY_DN3389_c0_g2_i26.p1 TRINITY_DN3389_c0_g2~~TRINITY_DN3389_c0_g2_i26.p1  ORF type:complete len:358 (-),score=21.69 TRINITY_DN3389_c0_g2_i26:323-1396(-)
MGNLCRRSVYSASDSKLEQGQPSESTQTWEGPAVVFGDAVTSVAATDDRSILVAGSEDKTVILYDWVLGRVVQRWNEHRRGVRTVIFCNHTTFSGSRDGTVRCWRQGEGASINTIDAHKLVVSALASSACGSHEQLLASGSRDCAVATWDVVTGQNISTRHIARNLVTAMSWLQSSTQFLQTSEDLHLRLWDSRSMQVVQDIKTDHHFALCCDTSPDGNYFVVGNNGFSSSGQHDGCETQVWDLRKSSLVCEFRNHSQSVNTCKFVSAGNQTMVASGSKDQWLHVWNATTAELQASCSVDSNLTISCLATQINEDGVNLILGNVNGSLQVWDLDFDKEPNLRLQSAHSSGIVAISRN